MSREKWNTFKRIAWLLLGVICVGVFCLIFGLELVKSDGTPFRIDELGRQNYGLATDHSEQGEKVAAECPPFQILGENGERIVQDNSRSIVRLWDATNAVLGRHTRNYAQQVGDCVSFGGKNVTEYVQCVRISRDGPRAGEFREVSTAYLYGVSRVFIGNGQLGNSDGSVGGWLAKGVQSHGILALDDDGVPAYSGELARTWGRRPGPPDKFVQIANKRLIRTVSPILTAEDARDAICNYYPMTIASDFGSTDIRNRDGQMVARRNTRWMHQMAVVGFDGTKGVKGRFYVLNSWGETAHPAPLNGEPPGGFWIEFADMDYITKQNDSWAFSDFDGFPAQELDFNVFGKVQKTRDNDHEVRGEFPGGGDCDGGDGVAVAGRDKGSAGLRRVWDTPRRGEACDYHGPFQGLWRRESSQSGGVGLPGIRLPATRSEPQGSGREAGEQVSSVRSAASRSAVLRSDGADLRLSLRPANRTVHVEVSVGLAI